MNYVKKPKYYIYCKDIRSRHNFCFHNNACRDKDCAYWIHFIKLMC